LRPSSFLRTIGPLSFLRRPAFAAGFLMRPLGGWVFGRLADTRGRRAALILSVVLMCGGSLLIAISPSYASVGIAAPAILLIARMAQGLSVGGEYGTSPTYLSEMAVAGHRGFYASFQYVTLIGGQLLSKAPSRSALARILTTSSNRTTGRIKARVGPMFGFKRFFNARRVLAGVELVQKDCQRPVSSTRKVRYRSGRDVAQRTRGVKLGAYLQQNHPPSNP
jgi:MFS family permease